MVQNRKPKPPLWAERFLERVAADHLLEEVQGDLQELFEKRLQYTSLRKARWLYVLDVLKLIHPSLWRAKPSLYPPLSLLDMFQHHLLLIYRNFTRFKGSFFINLIGLSTGLAGFLLIYIWVHDELKIDSFHEKKDRLFQVLRHTQGADKSLETHESNSVLLPPALLEELPGVEYVVPARNLDKGILSAGDKHLKAAGKCAGSDFFNIFSFPLQQGDKDQVLAEKNAIVISDELATNLFGRSSNVIGKMVHWDSAPFEGDYIISGVFSKPPSHSSQQFDFLFSYTLFLDNLKMDVHWGSNPVDVYLTLKEETNPEIFNKQLDDFYQSKMKQRQGAAWMGHMFLARYSDRYLYNQYENGIQSGGRIEYVKLFSLIAIFIVLIACINFMNLATSKAVRRSKEVGIKKVIGASRSTLIGQYLGESLVITFTALGLAVILVLFLLPQFNEITGKQLSLELDIKLILFCIGVTGATGLLAGSYPALYLSGFKPVSILKGRLPRSMSEIWVRKGLVVFQFSLSVLFIVSVLVVYKQITFIQTKNLGYDKNNIIHFASEGKIRTNPETFLSEVKKLPGVLNASAMAGNMTGAHSSSWGFEWEGKQAGQEIDFSIFYVRYNLIETLGIQLAQGRTFSPEFGAEEEKIIFNEAAIQAMGVKDPLGKTVKMFGKEKQIVGVVKDFHFESMYEKVKPACFVYRTEWAGQVMVKIAAGREQEAIRHIAQFYKEYNLGLPFEYQFLDQDYQVLYAAEQRVATLSQYFAGLAILISCLGLFGLASFTAERRRKEISIRKVLGSSEIGIIYLLSGEFTKMVLLAIGIALPISYILAKQWLNNFAFSIDLEWWYFIGAGLLAISITWLTVGVQAVKAAKTDPVKILREE